MSIVSWMVIAEVIDKGSSYKVKSIQVEPDKSLSLQRHMHRSEHWVVVEGTALVQVGEDKEFVNVNEGSYVPICAIHRLSNPGKIPLRIIEVQCGTYLEEDDIERFDDEFGRT